jgi:predicted  nucleic acid-binding Zn-ribbon protein
MNLAPELPISAEDWEKTRATVQTVVSLLWEENQALKAHMVQLQNQVEKLQTEVEKLREQVNKNSPNLVQTAFERPAAKAKLSQARAEWGEKRWAKRASRAWSEAERGRRSE